MAKLFAVLSGHAAALFALKSALIAFLLFKGLIFGYFHESREILDREVPSRIATIHFSRFHK